MPIRGGGLRSSTWTLRRAKEWNRHLGASLSMRIIASWFGSCRPAAYKYASVIIRQQRAPLGIDACEIGLSQSILSSPGRKHADTLNLVKEVTQCLEVSLDRMNPIQAQLVAKTPLVSQIEALDKNWFTVPVALDYAHRPPGRQAGENGADCVGGGRGRFCSCYRLE